MSRVLIVEDEIHIANGLKFNLEAEGHAVEVVGDGEGALELLLEKPADSKKSNSLTVSMSHPVKFDAMVLDVMLPGKDGFAVASELRAAKNFIPVLMLTARGRPEDVLKGFASGADDYLPKPFELPILLARLQGLLRRREWMTAASSEVSRAPNVDKNEPVEKPYEVFSFNGRTIDFGKLELRAKGNTIQLTLMEAELLRYLVNSSGRIVSRKSILEEVWGLREDTDTRAIDNFIVRLRRYIEDDPSKPQHLVTVRGVGYKFLVDSSEKSKGQAD